MVRFLAVPKTIYLFIYLFIIYIFRAGVLSLHWKLMNDDLCKFKEALFNAYLVCGLFLFSF